MSGYKVGLLEYDDGNSDVLPDYGEAQRKAMELSWNDAVCAIWNDDGNIVALVYQQSIYEEGESNGK